MARGRTPRRTKIPQSIADEVMDKADRRCCLCELVNGIPPRKEGQIHHLDRNPSNHDLGNLVFLCPTCHDKAEKRGGVTRRFSPPFIKRNRDRLYQKVALDRESKRIDRAPEGARALDARARSFTNALDAVVVTDFLMRRFEAGHEWSKIEEVVGRVSAYSQDIGVIARAHLLESLGDIASSARQDMPTSTARVVASQSLHLLPADVLARQPRSRFTKLEGDVFAQGVGVGAALIYDGALYRHELAIVFAGCDLLCVLLGFAVRAHQVKLKGHIEDAFKAGADGARRGKMPLAEQMMSMALEQGRSGKVRLPDYTKEIFDAL